MGCLAAEEHLILKDKRIPDSLAIKIIKPLASEQGRLIKRIWRGTPGPMTYQGTAEPEGMVDSPGENLLKQIIKGVNNNPATPIVIKQEAASPKIKREQPSTSGIKKEPKGTKPPIAPKPSKSESGGFKKAALSGATKGVLKSLGLTYKDTESKDEGGYSPKEKKKKYPKG